MPVSPARLIAFQILLRVERQSAFAAELLHSGLDALSPLDRHLATELVMGSLRWQRTLDELIAGASSQKLNKLDAEVLVALRLAAYQMLFLTRIPPSAAVNESVELVRRARKRSAVPFANAVLRKLGAKVRDDLPLKDLDSAAGLAMAFSHPAWLVERWANAYGLAAARRICESDQQAPATTVRLSQPGEEIEQELQRASITLAPGRLLRSARRVEAGEITAVPAFLAGRVMIQDEASQLVAALLPEPKEAAGGSTRILDCCAAPGGKTAVLAERHPRAAIVAVELHAHRAAMLRRRLQLGTARASDVAPQIEVVEADATRLPYGRDFDGILADVPCSGTGTLARNPEIRWKLRPEDLADLRERQRAILHAALGHLRPGGVLVYSTCSLEPEENAAVVEEVLRELPAVHLLDCRLRLEELQAEGELSCPDAAGLVHGPYLRTLPGVHPCEGFFAAMIGYSAGG